MDAGGSQRLTQPVDLRQILAHFDHYTALKYALRHFQWVVTMFREYDAHCASLELEIFGSRNTLRCLHFQRWFAKLRNNNSEPVRELDFRHSRFIRHHAKCDTEAAIRAKATTRALCPMDQECKHKGYRTTYPVLDEKLSRRRKCFRILPSHRRQDITDQIEWGARPARDLADWTPLVLLMFAKPQPAPNVSRKSKRQLPKEKSAPLVWNKSMRKTLDRLELLGLAFTDDLNERALITELFGALSGEARCLRRLRDTVTPPPDHSGRTSARTPDENETPATSSGFGKTRAQFAPDLEVPDAQKPSPELRKVKAKAPLVQETVTVPSNTNTRAEATQSRPKKIITMANMTQTEETAGENGGKTPEVAETEVATPTKTDTEIVIREPRFSGDEDWLGEEESLRPPTKRARCTEFTRPFPYTRRPDVDDLASWKEECTLFYKAQNVLKRLPGADMSKHTIPVAFRKQRKSEEDAPAPGPSQGEPCDDREEDWLDKGSTDKGKSFRSMLDHRTFCLSPENLEVDGGEDG